MPTTLNLKYAKVETQYRPLVRISPDECIPATQNTQSEQINAITSRSTSSNSCYSELQVRSSVVRLTCTAETQAQYPLMKPEDIFQNEEKTRLFTTFLNYKTFELMFAAIMNHKGDILTYWEGGLHSKDSDNRKYRTIF